jgi:hypothetical protein
MIGQAVVDHYQKTYELTYELWKQRNRTFLLLLVVIGAATLLTFEVPTADSLLLDLIAKLLDISGSERVSQLQTSFPFGILQSILLLVVFYLMVNLYHRATYVLRNYHYLGKLETEIREQLGFQEGTAAFTREGSYYWRSRTPMMGFVKWSYFVLLGLLLLAFLGGRIAGDFRDGNVIFGIVDIVIAAPTVMFFYAYVQSSRSYDREQEGDSGGGSDRSS